MSKKNYNKTICPVCKTENPSLIITCRSCGGYLRDRIASLHLFETLWLLIESPATAMQRIIIAQQKNYVFPIQMLFGFAYVALLFWLSNIGLLIDNLQVILLLIILLGPVAGIVVIMFLSMVVSVCLRLYRSSINFRDIRAVVSYSSFPIILSVLFIFPVEVGIFGMYLFTNEPSPFSLNPVVYSMVIGLDSVLIVWSIVLLIIGLKILSERMKVVLTTTLMVIVAALLPTIAFYSIVSTYMGVV